MQGAQTGDVPKAESGGEGLGRELAGGNGDDASVDPRRSLGVGDEQGQVGDMV